MKSLKDLLDAKIPRSAIATREAGGGVRLDYLSGYYVKTRLNEVIGNGKWEYEIIKRDLVFNGQVKRGNADVYSVSYLVDLRLTATIDGHRVVITDTGYGDGTDKTNPGKAHELAAKEAVTDALKRCASNLGQSMGLALYDKEQNYVDEEEESKASPAVNSVTAPKGVTAVNVETSKSELPIKTLSRDFKALKGSLKSAARVLDSTKKLALNDFKAKYKVTKVDELSDNDALNVYNQVKVDYPELKLN